MSFFDDASLVFLPSGQAGKDGKAYSMKPTNGDGDFTFSRGSNLTATRVDSNGLIEKGRENLLLQSNQFDTAWATNNSSVTSGQSGYDGSSDAWLLESNNTGGAYLSQNITASGVQTFSIYAKAGTCNFIYFVVRGSTNIASYFDLENGTIGTAVATNIDRKIESVGSGWYRCSITLSNTDTSIRVYMADADGSTASAVGSNIYIQDAQLEIGLAVTEYIESGASTGLAGILEDSPRFDYSGGASCPGLLLEPSRTQLISYSEYKATGDFTNSTPSYNAIVSPEGAQNATEIIDNSTNGQHRVSVGSFAVTSGTDYTISAFVKNNDIGYCYFLLEGDFTQTRYYFNLSTGQPITSGLKVENFENDWYRIYVTQSAAATGTGNVFLNMSDNGTTPIYAGSGSSLYFYGFQAEAASYPTSYIPNHSGGSVTREKDTCTLSTGGLSQTEGTIFIDYKDSPNKDVLFACSTSSGLITNNIRLSYNQLYIRNSTGNLLVASVTLPDAGKIAIKYDTNGVKIFSNGSSIYTNSTRISFDGSVDFVRIGSRVNDSGIEEINVDQFLIFTTALSDNNLITLTS